MTKQEETIQLIKDLLKYAEDNPEQRFWQCVRNFTKSPFIYISRDNTIADFKDTFYIENDKVINK